MKRRTAVGMVLAAAIVLSSTVSNAAPALTRPIARTAAGAVEPRAEVGLRRLLTRIVAAGVPGVIARVQEGRDARVLTAGVADLAAGTRLRPQARFRVGSITKTFVATVVLQLVGEGSMDLDQPVEDWLPGLLPDGDVITVRQLLNHTSGLFNYTNDPAVLAGIQENRVFEPEELVAVATAHPLSFPPGTAFEYSNTGYIVTGLLVEAVTGDDLGGELRRRIFQPLGLEHSAFLATGQIRGYHAHGYVPGDLVPTPDGTPLDVTEIDPSWAWAAGALVSNARDLSRFYRSLLGGELLDPSLLEEMQATVEDPEVPGTGYGLGIARIETPCGTIWGHDGALPGFAAWASWNEDTGRSVVIAVTMYPSPPASGRPLAKALGLALCGTRGATQAAETIGWGWAA